MLNDSVELGRSNSPIPSGLLPVGTSILKMSLRDFLDRFSSLELGDHDLFFLDSFVGRWMGDDNMVAL
jgi:hypothetical protein